MKKYFLIASILLVTQLSATDTSKKTNTSFNSEISHALVGVAIAGGVTAIVDNYYPEYAENRGMIGFYVSSAAGIVEQCIDYAEYGQAKGQLLDAASQIIGAAFGAFVTDKYILSPVVKYANNGERTVGVQLAYSF